MRVLLDHCVDVRFKALIVGHAVDCTHELGWERLSNGRLLDTAEEAGFEAFITTDKNLRHQQNISQRRLAVITLASRFTGIDDIAPLAPKVNALLDSSPAPGSHVVGP